MFTQAEVISSFSVDNIDKAKQFYGETLGLAVEVGPMGALDIRFSNGGRAVIYEKPDHEPATFTVLNFVTDDVEKTVDELNSKGITTKIYGDTQLPDMPPNDEKGIMRGEDNAPEIAWFNDPAGNVLAVVPAP